MKETYDVEGLITAFGGRIALIDILSRGANQIVKKKAVDKWVERGSIPSDMLIYCQIASDKLGLGILITDFIKQPKKG